MDSSQQGIWGGYFFQKKRGGYGPPTPVALRACQKLDTGGHNYMEMAQVGIELLMQLTLYNKKSRVAPLFVSFRLVVTAVAFPRNHNMEGQRIPSISHTVDRHLNRLCHFLALGKL